MNSFLLKLKVYTDADFSLINKPIGMSCHNDKDSLVKNLPSGFHLVHRLDKETSGLLMVTDKPELVDDLQKAMDAGQKIYRGILRGVIGPMKEYAEWNETISDSAEGRVAPRGNVEDRMIALTLYKSLKANEYFSAVDFILKTGRQHQIRKHSASFGRPVVGDDRYGNPKDNERLKKLYNFDRLALHAHSLEFKWKGKLVRVQCEIPKEFNTLIQI
jgi:23S rRNA-/tRNA-specific pseudouridylate synthase